MRCHTKVIFQNNENLPTCGYITCGYITIYHGNVWEGSE
jgi:hypothetical protein